MDPQDQSTIPSEPTSAPPTPEDGSQIGRESSWQGSTPVFPRLPAEVIPPQFLVQARGLAPNDSEESLLSLASLLAHTSEQQIMRARAAARERELREQRAAEAAAARARLELLVGEQETVGDTIYATIVISLFRCRSCQKGLFPFEVYNPVSHIADGWPDLVPLSRQCDLAGWAIPAGYGLCQECHDQEKLHFTCVQCKVERPSKEIYRSWNGDGAICTTCYATTPAQQWDSLLESLDEQHDDQW